MNIFVSNKINYQNVFTFQAMTRKLFLLVLLLSIFKISYSQTNHYGLSIGTSASFMERGERERYNTISSPKGPGFLISAFYNYKLNNYFGVVSNVSFNSRNVLEAPFTNIEGDEDFVKFNYLSITPLLKFDTNGNYNKGFYLKTGLSYEVLLNSKIKKDIFLILKN